MEFLGLHSLEWVSVPLKHSGEEERSRTAFSLFLGEGWSKPRSGELGVFLSSLLQKGTSRAPLKQASVSYH